MLTLSDARTRPRWRTAGTRRPDGNLRGTRARVAPEGGVVCTLAVVVLPAFGFLLLMVTSADAVFAVAPDRLRFRRTGVETGVVRPSVGAAAANGRLRYARLRRRVAPVVHRTVGARRRPAGDHRRRFAATLST